MTCTVLSIITVSAFEDQRLIKTMESLVKLPKEIEHVLIVPKSDSKAIKIWKEYGNLTNSKIFHDRALGIYPAMDLGAHKAEGKFIAFLNAGDSVCKSFSPDSVIQLLVMAKKDAYICQTEFEWRGPITLSKQNFEGFLTQKKDNYVSHQSLILSKQAYMEYANFDLKLRIAADFKQLLLIWRHGNFEFTNLVFAKVEYPYQSAISNRRGRVETFVILLTKLPIHLRFIAIIRFISNQFNSIR